MLHPKPSSMTGHDLEVHRRGEIDQKSSLYSNEKGKGKREGEIEKERERER